ncbi:MAG: hypothetical protein V5B60_07710 [Accumulibacter sp.]|jgi:hypothetical protein|uniref:hypothetical protein n=1 Tax=Accumulibacter sp. TaxID=2053492 RepID=UPI002FC39DA5
MAFATPAETLATPSLAPLFTVLLFQLAAGTGSYLHDTNPSYRVSLSDGAKALDVATTMGVVFRQDGMLPISAKAAPWTVEGWQLTVKLPKGADAQYVDQVYQLLSTRTRKSGSHTRSPGV